MASSDKCAVKTLGRPEARGFGFSGSSASSAHLRVLDRANHNLWWADRGRDRPQWRGHSQADVEIRNTSKGTTQSARTDREGGYRFSFLAPARYTLSVALTGFETENCAVDVLLGPPVAVNVTLRVAQARTLVSVTAEAPLVRSDDGDVSTTFTRRRFLRFQIRETTSSTPSSPLPAH
jgi:hypothetical protein